MYRFSRHRRAALAAVVTGALLGWAAAGAQNNCDRNSGDYDATYCLIKVYVQADADLNSAYAKLSGRLSVSARAELRSLEMAWIKRRNRECVTSSDQGPLLDMDCAVNITTQRANFLNDRYRECVTSGCRVSALR